MIFEGIGENESEQQGRDIRPRQHLGDVVVETDVVLCHDANSCLCAANTPSGSLLIRWVRAEALIRTSRSSRQYDRIFGPPQSISQWARYSRKNEGCPSTQARPMDVNGSPRPLREDGPLDAVAAGLIALGLLSCFSFQHGPL